MTRSPRKRAITQVIAIYKKVKVYLNHNSPISNCYFPLTRQERKCKVTLVITSNVSSKNITFANVIN